MKKVKVRKSRVQPNGRPSLSERLVELPDGLWENIAKKAYELYEQRGRREGRAMEDWLEAEAIIMDRIHEARE